jgi:hypothetical protein
MDEQEAGEVELGKRGFNLPGPHLINATVKPLDMLQIKQGFREIQNAGRLPFALKSRREVEPQESSRPGMRGILDDMVLAPGLAKKNDE